MEAARYDALVIGSGIGGLAAAAALASVGKRVLVLERHTQAGGLTQSFERQGFRFNVGVHYLGGFGPDGLNRRLFERLAGGRIEMAPIPGAYDRVHFPDFSLAFAPPATTLKQTLAAAFPHEARGIDAWFDALAHGERAMGALHATHSSPGFLATPLAWIKRDAIKRWVGRTTWEVACETVQDPKLRALLCAQWGDYGSRPQDSAFGMHATVMSHYLDGAWFPVGGSASFAREFGRSIVAAGGALRTGAEVSAVRCAGQRVLGVTLADGETIDCRCVVSDIGIHNTLRLLPSDQVDYQWAADAMALEPSTGHVGLYLGLEGDIAAHGADTANQWIYDSWDVNALWTDPFTQPRAPAIFVSFPSLRDPLHDPGPRRRHTAEVVALVDWNAFSQWDRSDADGGMKKGAPAAARSESYQTFKALLELNLRRQFEQAFPDLARMIVLSECSTPISLATYTGAEHGAMYGLEATPRRFLSAALRPRTPIGGLFLAGQDACTPGVTGAFFGGLMAAANAEPKLYSLLR
jgi:phytoene dehydrogenase-like protein